MAIQQGHIVWGTVRIADSNILLPVVLHNEVQGGYHSVAALADRNALPAHVRSAGMVARVWNDGSPSNNGEYILVPGTVDATLTNNGNWIPAPQGNTAINKMKVDFADTDASVSIDWGSIHASFGLAPASILAWKLQDDNTSYAPLVVQSVIDAYPVTTLTVFTNNETGFLIIM